MDTRLTTRTNGEIVTTDARSLTHNPAAVYLAGLGSELSRRTMRAALDKVAQIVTEDEDADALTFPWHALTFARTAAIRARLAERYAPATANKMICAVRGAMKAAWRLGLMSAEDYHQAADVAAVKGTTLPAGRSITSGELAALMDVCAADATPAGARDAALVAVLYSCGLRRAEVTALDLGDFDQEANTLYIRGKGRRHRLAHVIGDTRAAIDDWLVIRGERPGPLFVPIRKGGHLERRRLTTTALYAILQRRADQAHVAQCTPHDFRRSFVGDLLDAGADIATVQRLAGHQAVTTTARYDRRPEATKRKAAELLHVPYRRRRQIGY